MQCSYVQYVLLNFHFHEIAMASLPVPLEMKESIRVFTCVPPVSLYNTLVADAEV